MKQILFLLFISLVLTPLSSQNKWSVGPNISIGFSGQQQTSEDILDYSSSTYTSKTISKVQPSFGIGFSAERYIGKRWGINLGVAYNFMQHYDFHQNSSQTKRGLFVSDFYASNQNRLIAHQIQTPFQARFYFGKKSGTRPFLSAGGVAIYTIAAKQENKHLWSSTGNTSQFSDSYSYQLDEEWSPIKRLNFTPTFGLGIDFGIFSIEINRTNVVLKKEGYSQYNLIESNSFIPLETKKSSSTLMTIKYKL